MNRTWQVRAVAHGRSELAGNHVDHQGGKVLAATIDRSCVMHAASDSTSRVHILSDGFEDVLIDLDEPRAFEPHVEERLTSTALVRGCIAGLVAHGLPISGFEAQVSSSVPAGSGLSSSAAFELACICALDALFGSNDLPAFLRARIGREAECAFFGKPCGLMDQTAIAYGGICAIDFANETSPQVERIDCDIATSGWSMLLVDSRTDHANQNAAFSQITHDMQSVALYFGHKRLGDIDPARFLEQLAGVRAELGDRAALRALHYYNETKLVSQRIDALKANDLSRFMQLSQRSSASSAQYLQNLSVAGAADQSALVALALADITLDGCGSSRIHGGGFGGAIQVLLPAQHEAAFVEAMEALLGAGCCLPVRIVDEGAGARWI